MADDVPQSIPRNPHEVHRVLLFEYGANEQYALPLVQVRRVELLDMNRVEQIGARVCHARRSFHSNPAAE